MMITCRLEAIDAHISLTAVGNPYENAQTKITYRYYVDDG